MYAVGEVPEASPAVDLRDMRLEDVPEAPFSGPCRLWK
jgi:hypothetical protein